MANVQHASREICSRNDVGHKRRSPNWWTDEATDLLRRLWKEGLSTRQISARLWLDLRIDKSRNAVIGRQHRLGLRAKPQNSQPKRRALSPRKRRSPPSPAERTQQRAYREAAPLLEPIGAHKIEHREEGTCRFISGDPLVSYQLCGRPGAPWCPTHRALVYTSSSRAKPTTNDREKDVRRQSFRNGWAS